MARHAMDAALEHCALHIGSNGNRPAHKAGKARRAAADHAPDQPEQQQRQYGIARQPMPVEHAVFTRPPTDADQQDQRPVEQPNRRVPDANALNGHRLRMRGRLSSVVHHPGTRNRS